MTGVVAALSGCAAVQGGGGAGASGFSVAAAPAVIDSITNSAGPVTATVAGGTSPFVYQWKIRSGAGILIGTPTAASTSFSCLGTGERNGVVGCTVLDSDGNTATSNDVTLGFLTGGGED